MVAFVPVLLVSVIERSNPEHSYRFPLRSQPARLNNVTLEKQFGTWNLNEDDWLVCGAAGRVFHPSLTCFSSPRSVQTRIPYYMGGTATLTTSGNIFGWLGEGWSFVAWLQHWHSHQSL